MLKSMAVHSGKPWVMSRNFFICFASFMNQKIVTVAFFHAGVVWNVWAYHTGMNAC
jgi:hypothetical protein